MDTYLPITITVQHKSAVSMAVLTETVSLVNIAAANASRTALREMLAPGLNLSYAQQRIVLDHIDATVGDGLWLEAVEAGSSKFMGKVRAAVFGGLTLLGGAYVEGSLEHSKHWEQVVTESGKKLDEAWEGASGLAQAAMRKFEYDLRRELQNVPDKPQDGGTLFRLREDADRLKLDVIPSRRKTDIASF